MKNGVCSRYKKSFVRLVETLVKSASRPQFFIQTKKLMIGAKNYNRVACSIYFSDVSNEPNNSINNNQKFKKLIQKLQKDFAVVVFSVSSKRLWFNVWTHQFEAFRTRRVSQKNSNGGKNVSLERLGFCSDLFEPENIKN